MSTFEKTPNMKNILIASTSTVYGKPYLTYILPELARFFNGVTEILFIPYARPGGITHDEYTKIAGEAFEKIHIKVKGVHEFNDPIEAVQQAKGIFCGGGNTFVLLNALYENKIISALKNAVNHGTPYFGTSAGSNITGQSIKTTNDMPIVYPPSFDALGFIKFNINPHYLDPVEGSTHMGETRETRINEFLTQNDLPVIGLREGSWLVVNDMEVRLKGELNARLFVKGKPAQELPPETDLTFLS